MASADGQRKDLRHDIVAVGALLDNWVAVIACVLLVSMRRHERYAEDKEEMFSFDMPSTDRTSRES